MTVPSLAAAPTTIAAMCTATRRMLSQNLNDELVFLAEPYEVGDSILALRTTTRRLGPGSVLSGGDNTFYVISVGQTSASVEVVNGYDGAPSAAAEAGSALRVNPRFTDYTLLDTISSVIASLSSPSNGLYGVYTQTINGMVGDGYIPIPAEIDPLVMSVLSVMSRYGSTNDWLRNTEYTVSLRGGKHVRVFAEALQHQVTYALRFIRPSSFTDDAIIDCGLTESMLDIPPLGAAAILMQGQEARRANQRAQGDPRRAEDVPMTAAVTSARELYRMFRERIDEEHATLVKVNPYTGRAF